MYFGLQSTYIIDDIGYASESTPRSLSFIPWNRPNLTVNVGAVFACRDDLGHWDHLMYDPTLGALFSSFVSPTTPGDASNPTSNSKTTAIAVGVSVSAAVVIGAIIVALFIFYPPFRKFVTPFSGATRARSVVTTRDSSAIQAHQNSSSENRWTVGHKGTNDLPSS